MKKIFYLFAILLLTSSCCFAITEDDKTAIRASIDETYKYVYYNPEPEARSKAKEYVKDKYFYAYIKCKNNCEVELDRVRAKANNFSIFTDPAKIQKEANETFNSCMAANCNAIKEIKIQECYDYIDQYIELKNQARKK